MNTRAWISAFENTPTDPIMRINIEYRADPRTNKINAGIGMILDPKTSKPFVPSIVKKVAQQIALDDVAYLPSLGHVGYLDAHARYMVFGETVWEQLSQNIEGLRPHTVVWAQTFGGTKALSLAAALLSQSLTNEQKHIIVDTGWPNYNKIFSSFTITHYQHENTQTHAYNRQEYIDKLKIQPIGSVVVLQVGGYNDDGTERTTTDWEEIVAIVKSREMIPILDFAYNGLVNGWEKDNDPVKLFTQKGIITFVCTSNSKNVAYNARLGSIYIVNLPAEKAGILQNYLENAVIRPDYSNPVAATAQVMDIVLRDDKMRAEYFREIDDIRVNLMDFNRNTFAQVLGEKYAWIANKRGMFFKLSHEEFSDEQVRILKDEHAVFGPKSSRLNLGGFDPQKVEEIAQIYKNILS